MPVDLVALAHAQSRQVPKDITVYTCNAQLRVKSCTVYLYVECVDVDFTMHLVALYEIFILL